MVKSWDIYSRQTIDLASSATSFGFGAAKACTKLGFAVTRGIASTAVGLTTTVVDHALFGGSTVTKPVVGGAVSTVISLAEQITLAPLHLGEYITNTSLFAAHSSINVLSVFFPGSSDASFSLASFITLVKKELNEPGEGNGFGGGSPESARNFGIMVIAKAIIAWVALQGVTQEWQERKWLKKMKEIDVRPHEHTRDPTMRFDSTRSRKNSRVRVTSEVKFPDNRGQIIAADIGDAPRRAYSIFASTPAPSTTSSASRTSYFTNISSLYPSHHTQRMNNNAQTPSSSKRPVTSQIPSPKPLSNTELKTTLRRLSKMVLAGYGGASLLFFGVPLTATPGGRPIRGSIKASGSIETNAKGKEKEEEAELARAVNASEAEAAGDEWELIDEEDTQEEEKEYSWWDVLLGRHDIELFEKFAKHDEGKNGVKDKEERKGKGKEKKADVVIGREHLMPRFWVLTDHSRGEVVLVLRGTMSLNEIAVDLTCHTEEFEPASAPAPDPDDSEDDGPAFPGQFFAFPRKKRSTSISSLGSTHTQTTPRYLVHSGMLRMAHAMGDIGKPVQLAVHEALYRNPGYNLVLCGHSLGAGVGALLGLMWASPVTCLTVPSSGLPINRRVSVYCFAPPAVCDAALGKLASKLIVSFVYSHDVVSRLSLGSVRDLRNAAAWLCESEARDNSNDDSSPKSGYSAVTNRASRWKSGAGKEEDMNWFISVRKTLEANMHQAHTFPPGKVLWALRDGDLHPAHRIKIESTGTGVDRLRLFEVLDVEEVFGQIVFAKDMLGAHMPHKYDSVLHDLL
ncbi:alpha/beta-hydrolase, partial [Dendrothele bispora CBS 962.96]